MSQTLPAPITVAGPDEPPTPRIAVAFYIILLGQLVSMMGSQLTGFGLGVWLFQSTHSVMNFSALALSSTLPALLLLPWSGSLADRWNCRTILIACEVVAIACTAGLAMLLYFHVFTLGRLMALQAVLSVSAALQGPAFSKALTVLVPKELFAKAAGGLQAVMALAQLGGPLLAAVALQVVGIVGILAIDAASFMAALVALFALQLPRTEPNPAGSWRDAWRDLRWALAFVGRQRSAATLFGYMAVLSWLNTMVTFLLAPLVLARHTSAELAFVATCAGLGVLASGLVLMLARMPGRFTPRILLLLLLQGVAMVVAGRFQSMGVLCACAFVGSLTDALCMGYIATIWRAKVPSERQGCFAALLQAVALAQAPLAAILAGVLVERVLGPLLSTGGALGRWAGDGAQPGIGVLLMLVGIGVIAIALAVQADSRLRDFDSHLRDAT